MQARVAPRELARTDWGRPLELLAALFLLKLSDSRPQLVLSHADDALRSNDKRELGLKVTATGFPRSFPGLYRVQFAGLITEFRSCQFIFID